MRRSQMTGPSILGKILGFALAVVLCLSSVPLVRAVEKGPVKPSKRDKCPVCGMFVYKYPDWVCRVIFRDGSAVFFDGAKDLFKYYFNLEKYNPGKSENDIAAIHVTEYYDMKPIDAYGAYFVVGSDVYGPMGKELIPFSTKADAEEFLRDHHGKRVFRFRDVNPVVIEKLD